MNILRLIRCAAALERHRNFARAARSLNMTQPNLSRGIAALEQSVGAHLFDRTSQGAIPTAVGRVLLERGAELLKGESALRRDLLLLAGAQIGSLAVSSGPFPAAVAVPIAVARLLQAHPRLSIRCLTDDPDRILQDVIAERIDVGVAQVTGFEKDERIVIEPIPPMRVYLACRPGHPLTRERRPTFAHALAFPLATSVLRGLPAAAAALRSTKPTGGDHDQAEFVPQVVVNSSEVARRIARASDVIVPGTAAMLHDDVATGHLVLLPVDAPFMRTVHGVFYLRDRTLAPTARVFIDILMAVEAEVRAAEKGLTNRRRKRRTR